MSDMPCVVSSVVHAACWCATLMRVLPDAGFRVFPFSGDLRDATAIAKQIAQAAPAYVVHAAAMTYVAACERQPQQAFAVNGEGAKNVVEAARAVGAPILYISTASVFRGDHGDYRDERMHRSRRMPTTNPSARANGARSITSAAWCCGSI